MEHCRTTILCSVACTKHRPTIGWKHRTRVLWDEDRTYNIGQPLDGNIGQVIYEDRTYNQVRSNGGNRMRMKQSHAINTLSKSSWILLWIYWAPSQETWLGTKIKNRSTKTRFKFLYCQQRKHQGFFYMSSFLLWTRLHRNSFARCLSSYLICQ
jgi:hypothetical protein